MIELEFTPLEFETLYINLQTENLSILEFTPLEFETTPLQHSQELPKH